VRLVGVEFIDENGGGPGVRLRKRQPARRTASSRVPHSEGVARSHSFIESTPADCTTLPGLCPLLGCAHFGRLIMSHMRIIARRTLREFVEARRGYKDYIGLKGALDAWFDEVKKARWSSAADIRRSHATASIVSADRVVFNIKGNDYRLVVAIDFEKSIVWIKWIGTHKDYDKINVKEVQHGR
jgi:mRNA interferase HigB